MILRIAQGRLLAGRDAQALADLRDQLTVAARSVRGLESLIVGARRAATDPDPATAPPIEAAIVTVWHDATAMLTATAVDEAGRFLGGRLALPFAVDHADHYEILERTFAALPPEAIAVVRILRVRARPNEEARLVATLRAQQPRFVDLGLVASHLGRRLTAAGEVEAALVGVWPDRATVRHATHGQTHRPLFAEELADWRERTDLEMFDGIEIAPKLPAASGPPLIVLDEALRIVDLTSSAAAMLGLPAEELVGRRAEELFRDPGDPSADAWPALIDGGSLEGEASWEVPEIGQVLVRFHARRDVPIAGRHTVLIRRRHDPAPTADDLAGALREAFPVA